MEILMNDINLFTVPALTKTATKQAQWGAEGVEEEEEEENVALADSVRYFFQNLNLGLRILNLGLRILRVWIRSEGCGGPRAWRRRRKRRTWRSPIRYVVEI
jgi:hypothetical protein